MTKTSRSATLASVAFALALATTSAAVAQVRYLRPAPSEQVYLNSPYDESYGLSPSYQIFPYAYGGPAVRVIERCQYPNGWNVTDFGRDINGIPNGADHACPVRAVGGRVRARY